GAAARMAGLRRRPAQPGADGGACPPPARSGPRGRGGRLGRRCARSPGVRLPRRALGIGPAIEPPHDDRRAISGTRRPTLSGFPLDLGGKMSAIIRPLTEADLPAARRIVNTAFGTFLGASDVENFWADRDLVYGRFGADH